MKKYFGMLVLCCLGAVSLQAQVGMTSNNPNKNAVLDLNKTDGTNTKGLLLPKVALTAINNSFPMSAHIAGMKVYNTATAGTGINAVVPGEYCNDGTKWVRTSSFVWGINGNANTIAGTNFIGTADSNDFVIKTNNTEGVRVKTSGNVGIGTNSPNARLDIRTSPASTTDPGVGFLGVGTTTTAANTAGAGALRYSTRSGGVLEYSNGTVWNQLSSTVVKTVVIAKKTTPQTFVNTTWTLINDWTELADNNNSFNASTGTFTAPRDGLYTISLTYTFIASTVAAGGQIEAILYSPTDPNKTRKSICAFPAGGNVQPGTAVSFVFDLNAGDQINASLWQDTSTSQTLLVGTGGNDGFVNFSVAEL